MLRLLALVIPFIFISNSLRGALEAKQRFDLINSIKVPYSALIYIAPLAGWWIGWQIDNLTLLLIIIVVISFIAYLYFCMRIYPGIVHGIRISSYLIKDLISYSSWIAVSNFVAPILTYLDRFLISNLLSIAVLAYYSAPYEALTRLWFIPRSMTATLFPAFSRSESQNSDLISRENLSLLSTSLKFIILLLGPISLIVMLFPRDILKILIDVEFAQKSAGITQALMLGIFINSIGRIPTTMLYGKGRPDISAKLELIELPCYIILSVVFIHRLGIEGAAFAWAIRVFADTILLFWSSNKLGFIPYKKVINRHLGIALVGLLTIFCISTALNFFGESIPLINRLGFTTILLIGYEIVAWYKVLDSFEQNSLSKTFHKLINNFSFR